jgi:hypothetical protein
MLKQYSDALAPLRESAARAPNIWFVHVCLAATHAQLGQFNEAHAAVTEILRIVPSFSIERSVRPTYIALFKHTHDVEHIFDGLRKAGLPE